MESFASKKTISRRNTTQKVALRDAPISRNGLSASDVVIPQAQEAADWGAIAAAAAALTAPRPDRPSELSVDIDSPDNSDFDQVIPKPVSSEDVEMVYDPRTGYSFPVTINLPGVGGGSVPAPAPAPPVDEAAKRKQLIMIFAGMLVLLLIILFLISRKK